MKEIIESTNGIKLFVSGSLKKSTGNYGMIEINFGISKDINTNDSIEEEQDKLYDEVEKGIEKYIESLFILSKEFDEKSKKFEEMKKKQQMNRFD